MQSLYCVILLFPMEFIKLCMFYDAFFSLFMFFLYLFLSFSSLYWCLSPIPSSNAFKAALIVFFAYFRPRTPIYRLFLNFLEKSVLYLGIFWYIITHILYMEKIFFSSKFLEISIKRWKLWYIYRYIFMFPFKRKAC